MLPKLYPQIELKGGLVNVRVSVLWGAPQVQQTLMSSFSFHFPFIMVRFHCFIQQGNLAVHQEAVPSIKYAGVWKGYKLIAMKMWTLSKSIKINIQRKQV